MSTRNEVTLNGRNQGEPDFLVWVYVISCHSVEWYTTYDNLAFDRCFKAHTSFSPKR